ncbi:MarR family winged helix-turn-helix transcriptional regulator [Desertimonas flava]|jgi:DNA-binding MarR family transcriptional regulator|uniref:MarR family winged helix-turn-helix transcriptional regulator n=1 Tax=Desertimonas flava TaxID=2064846 RepID=UPI000E355E98|nr:MarR family transcriptional regulator [Desertimonas flava]
MSTDADIATGTVTDTVHDVAARADVTVEGRELLDLSARFARGFARFLDGKGSGGFSYPHLRVLETLHCQGPSTMRPLAEGLGLTARNLTAVADALESDGLLRRVGHPTDRRATILELTDAGLAAADESLAPRFGEIMALFDRLSPSDRAQFARTLAELVDAMEAGCPREAVCGGDDGSCPDAAC